jgi:hypothetical protein
MLYGEGSRAFIRLQEEIVKEYDDETVFAWRSSTAVNYTGLFAQSPADFARSGNIFPYQSTSHQTEPVSVSSRGLRIIAPLSKMEEFANATFLVQLNCKNIHFDIRPGERVGIAVAKRFGVGDVYARIMPNDLYKFQPKGKHRVYEVKTIFALKENHIKEFGLMEYCGFWIRTSPLWPELQIYHLTLAHPCEFWDPRNNMFRRSWRNGDKRPFVLVFRKDANADKTQHSYFIVFLGVKEKGNWSMNQMWCNVKFCHAWDLKAEDLDWEANNFDREDMYAQFRGQRDKFSQDEGDGVTLKCYVQLEVAFGQQLFCADLHIKTAQDSSHNPIEQTGR